MKVEVASTCSGHARCASEGPRMWPLDEIGHNVLAGRGPVDVPAGLEREARDGAAACPERAISIHLVEGK